ncbi:MAG TPA: hypothetical protein VGM56_33355 [Byssovorax sp.]|jgi:hypothetical protein
MTSRAVVALAWGAAAAIVASSSGAQPAPARRDPAAAEALFAEGRSLRAAGRIKEACPKFAASYRLDPALGALLNLASCHEIEGRTATAWAEYREAEDEARRGHDDKRAAFAKKRAAALEPALAKLTVTLAPGSEDVAVTRDGEPIDAAALGAPLPIDGGAHVLEARRSGYVTWKKELLARDGDRLTIDVPPLERAPEPVVAPVATAPLDDGGAAREVEDSRRQRRTIAVVVGGAGVAGVGVGIAFGVLTGNAAAQAKGACPNDACTPAGLADVSRGKTYAWASDVGFIAGGAALAAAGVLFWTSRAPAPSPSKVALTPAPGGASLRVAF